MFAIFISDFVCVLFYFLIGHFKGLIPTKRQNSKCLLQKAL